MRNQPFDVESSDDGESLPGWAASLLRQPAASRPGARRAIMDAVRREGAPVRRRIASPSMRRGSRWPRRGLLTAFGAAANVAAFAAMFAAFVSVQSVRATRAGVAAGSGPSAATSVETSAFLIGDTVIALHDDVHGRVRDTLRIVEFVLRGADVASAAVVGDFNGWRPGATTLQRGTDGAWRARVLVPRDMVRFAYDVTPVSARPASALRARLDSI